MTTHVDLGMFREHLAAGRLLLTPGLRLTRQISRAFLEEQLSGTSTAVAPPKVFAIDAWLEMQWRLSVEAGRLPEARLLSRMEERLLWQEIITSEQDNQGAFTLLQPVLAAEQALQARHEWLMHGGDGNSRAERQRFELEPDCAAFARWCSHFQRRISALGARTRADAYRELLTVTPENESELVLCHALNVPPLTRQLLAHMGRVTELGAGDAAGGQPVSALTYASRGDELAAVAEWAAERHRDNLGTTAVVLLDFHADRPQLEYYLRQQFGCLGQRYATLPVNFSTGMPLSQTPLYRDALLGLRLLVAPSHSRGDVLAALQSPFLTAGEAADRQSQLALRRALTDLKTERIDRADLLHLVRKLAPDSALAVALQGQPAPRELNGKRLPSDWLPMLFNGLRQWQWPGRQTLDSLEHQQFERFEASLDGLVTLDALLGPVKFSQLLDCWERSLGDAIFQPKTEDSAVQVLGPREALGLSFDAIWVCGWRSGVMPTAPRNLPFLPANLQRQLGMRQQNADCLLEDAWALLNSWRTTHGEVRGSFARFQEGVEVLPSPLLAVTPGQVLRAHPDRPEHWPSPSALEVHEEFNVPIEGDLIPWGGGASVIANQSNCPFRAWVTHRLGLQPVAAPVLGLSPMERGDVVHDALRHLWEALGSSENLRACDDQQRRGLIAAAVDWSLSRLDTRARQPQGSVRKRVGGACLDLERDRVTALMLQWLELESDRPGQFRVLEQEDEHRLPVGPLTLRLRPDRIDELADGRHVVIDYKTGNVNRNGWLGDRPREPQLPLYALLDARVQGLAFARVHASGSEFLSLGDELGLANREKDTVEQLRRSVDADVASWAELHERWRLRLTELAEEYAQGHAAIDPQPNACRYCPFDSVCRFAVSDGAVESLASPAEGDIL